MMTFSFAPVISLLQSASLDFVHLLSLTANKKIHLLQLFPSKDDFLVMEPFVDRVAEVEFVFQVLSLLAKNYDDSWLQ